MLEPISGHMALVLDIQSPNINASNATAACLSLNQGKAAHFFKRLIAPETLKTERRRVQPFLLLVSTTTNE